LEWDKTGTIPAFAVGPRKAKKTLCGDGRSQFRFKNKHGSYIQSELIYFIPEAHNCYHTQNKNTSE
jgi:hypothetical protein